MDTHFLRPLAWLGIGAVMLGPVHGAVASDPQKQVLVLYSTRRDAQIAVVSDRELPRILDGGLAQGLDLYSEYLDLARFPDPEYRSAFHAFLRTKYRDKRFDVVIAMHDNANEVVRTLRDELFRDVPLVFLTSSRDTPRIANSTGIIAELNFRATVTLALQLQPDTRHLFVVNGAGASDRAYERVARAQLGSFEPDLQITYLSGLPTPALETRVSALPEHSVVFFLLVTTNSEGENLHPLEYVDRITAAADAPTYSWVDSTMEHGVVGGSLRDQSAAAAAVAALALRVLKGEPADSIPLASSDLNVPQVDWRQLQRWRISEARVPAGTRIRFRQPGLWAQYKAYVVAAGALLVAESILIAGLLVQLGARRRAEAKLQAIELGLRNSRARVLEVVENERFRIARELHDDIGQRIAALTMSLHGLGAGVLLPGIPLQAQIETLANRSLDLAKDIQTISRNLHFSRLDFLGLEAACADFCRELSAQQPLTVDFAARNMPEDLDKEIAVCVYRVVQESVSNALAHARARRVNVDLWDGGGELRLEVVDDGKGFDPDVAMHSPGLGLISMQERIRLVAGELWIESRPGAGTTIRARVPLTRVRGSDSGAVAPA